MAAQSDNAADTQPDLPAGDPDGLEHIQLLAGLICPGRKPPFLLFKRPAGPYKRPIETDLHRKTLMALNRPKAVRTESACCLR